MNLIKLKEDLECLSGSGRISVTRSNEHFSLNHASVISDDTWVGWCKCIIIMSMMDC